MRTGNDLDRNGISQQNIGIYCFLLHDSLNIKQLLYMISLSTEFNNLRISKEQELELNELKEYSSYFIKGKQMTPSMVKVFYLLLARLDGKELSDSLHKDQQNILNLTFKVISSVIDAAFVLNYMHKGKKIPSSVIETILDFSRRLVQRLPLQAPCAAMIPEITDNKAFFKSKNIAELKNLLENNKNPGKVNNNEVETIMKQLNEFPEFSIECAIANDENNEIRLGDIATLKIKIIRSGINSKSFDNVKAPFIDFVKTEKIWVIIADSKKIIFVKSFDTNLNTIEDNSIKIPIERNLGFSTGKACLYVEVKSDSYLGVDKSTTLEFPVLNQIKKK